MILALFMCFNGCEENQVSEESLPVVIDELTVDQAKAFVETQRMSEFTLKSGKTERKKINIRSDWTKSERSNNGNISVVETKIQAMGGFGFATSDCMEAWNTSKNDAYLYSMSKLVVIKHKKSGEVYSFIMSIAADKPYLEGKKFKLWGNTYLKRDKNLTGYVLFHDLSGAFVNGWIYCDGQITNSLTQPNHLDLPIELKSAMLMTPIYQWVRECDDWQSNYVDNEGTPTVVRNNCTETLVIVGYFGSDNGGGGGSSGDSTSGATSGTGGTSGGYDPIPSAPTPEPCTCLNVCPDCGKCKDELILKSGSTSCIPWEVCSCPAPTKEQVARSQIEYLKVRGVRDLAEIFEELLSDPTLPMRDVDAIYAVIEKAYLQLKAEYVMAVFSPDNVAAILGLFFTSSITNATKMKSLKAFADWETKIVNPNSTAILQNGYYEVNGFRFSEYYYNRLWSTGRGGSTFVARNILNSGVQGIADSKPGFYRYVYDGWEMVYNPLTKEIYHIQPI